MKKAEVEEMKTETTCASRDAMDVRSLLNFAAKVLTARERVQMTMADSRMGVFREEEIADLPGVTIASDDGEWLRLQRQKETKPTSPPEHITPFLENEGNNPSSKPQLQPASAVVVTIDEASDLEEAGLLRVENVNEIVEDGITRNDVVRVILLIEDMDEVRNDFEDWLSNVWAAWAERERPIRKSIALYDALFRVHSTIHVSDGVPPEIIWGFGIGIWQNEASKVEMPIIEQEVEIEIVSGGDLILAPRDKQLELNLKPYLQIDVPNSSRLQSKLSETLELVRAGDTSITPNDFTVLVPILEASATDLHQRGQFINREDAPVDIPKALNELRIYERWSVYARPRSTFARAQDIEKLSEQIAESGKPPVVLKGFVAPEPDKEINIDPFGLDSTALCAATGNPDDGVWNPSLERNGMRSDSLDEGKQVHFFPLPHNHEQADIVNALEGRGSLGASPVVSVTGPPGTGKSHTIANLIAHAMARGQRVLVTARTAEAIMVVRDKLPKSLQPLIIASTGTDRESTEALKLAVSELSDAIVSMNVEETQQRRVYIENELANCDEFVKNSDKKLAEIAKANLDTIRVDGKDLAPMELAPVINSARDKYGWFTDRPERSLTDVTINDIRTLQKTLPSLANELVLLVSDSK